MNLWRRI